ncbi:MAG: HAD family hydrolase [Lachnospiraceae bacterium]|nr:HAD family hydrolase [Lachnospiraceae bacterium]
MGYKAVVFDLFETLVTEWGHRKYTKREMSEDLGIDKETFDIYWEEKELDRYVGSIDFEDSIRYVFRQCGKTVDEATLAAVTDLRISTKAGCFTAVLPEVTELLKTLRRMGLKTAILSNCSSEEVRVLMESEIASYFDEIVLSYEVGMKKPDAGIYEEATRRLGIPAAECLFVGDGGSNELVGARNAGMTAVQAKWYTNRFPVKRGNIEGFPAAEEPAEIPGYLEGK